MADLDSILTRVLKMARAARAHPAATAIAVALLPRLLFLFELRAKSPTFAAPEGGDSILYDRLASGTPGPPRAFFHSPFYIAFLKSLYGILGRDLFAVRLVQHVLGALGCGLCAHLAWRVFHSRGLALAVGMVAALVGPIVFYEGMIGMDGLMSPLVMLTAALAVRAWQRRTLRSFVALGFALGAAALGRAVILAWLPLLLLWAARRPNGWSRCAALLVGTTVTIAPATIHNYVEEGIFVPITANGGLNFFIGNNETSNGGYVLPHGLAFRPGDPNDDFEGRRAAEQDERHSLTSAEVSSWWFRRSWAFVRSQPGRVARLVGNKVRILLNDAEYPQLHDYDAYEEVAPVLTVLPTAGFILVPGLAGLVTIAVSSKRRPLARRLAALAVVFAASFLPFFVIGRYRAPWILLLAPFAVWWMREFVVAFRGERWRPLIAFVVLGIGLTVISTAAMAKPSASFQYVDFAVASVARGDRRGAEHWCLRALAVDSACADAAALLGRLRREDGRYNEAEDVLEAALRKDPRASAVWRELGRVRLETDRVDLGIDALLASVDADPRSIETWSLLAEALRRVGRDKEASAAERSAERLKRVAEQR